MLSVLQISDLHRSIQDPVTNAELVATITQEHDRAVASGMRAVEAIVICGDLIQGCGLGTPNHERELHSQYEVAEDLVRRLSEVLIDGDLGRVIVVPGNHDVCWNTARAAMTEASPAELEKAWQLLHERASPFRWDWKTRSLFRITDYAKYNARLDVYNAFVERLFSAALPERVDEHATIRVIGGVVIAALSSCSGLDCFNRSAEIPPASIAQVATTLRGRAATLSLAVWHHNIDGPPTSSDYLDQACIRRLVYHGFRLGFHGHQHFAATAPVYIQTDRDQSMAVVSAASLCAGRRELPPGRNRGFNFVTIDPLHHRAVVRSMAMDLEARVQPEYAFNGGSAEREVVWTADLLGGSSDSLIRSLVLKAEDLSKRNDQIAVIETLVPHAASLDAYGRTLLIKAFLQQRRFDELLHLFGEQLEANELPEILLAMINAGQSQRSEEILRGYESQLLPGAVDYLRTAIRASKGQN